MGTWKGWKWWRGMRSDGGKGWKRVLGSIESGGGECGVVKVECRVVDGMDGRGYLEGVEAVEGNVELVDGRYGRGYLEGVESVEGNVEWWRGMWSG